MPLVIKSSKDLLAYVKARKKYADRQRHHSEKDQNKISQSHIAGMMYAWEESIKAIEALIEFEKLHPIIQEAQKKFLVSSTGEEET